MVSRSRNSRKNDGDSQGCRIIEENKVIPDPKCEVSLDRQIHGTRERQGIGESPAMPKRRAAGWLEASTPKRIKAEGARSVSDLKSYTPTLFEYVNGARHRKLSIVNLTPSPKANTPASKRLVLEQFFSKKARGEGSVEQKKLNDLLDDPLGHRIASVMEVNPGSKASSADPVSVVDKTLKRNGEDRDISNNNSVLKIAAKIHASEVPEEIVGREYEKECIEKFWREHVLKGVGASLCITGCPGSGKTASLNHFIKNKLANVSKEGHPIKVLQLNCISLVDHTKLFSVILQKFGGRKHRNKLLEEATIKSMFIPPCAQMKRKLPVYVIVLDEIDHMVHKNQRDIYHLFEWASVQGSRLVFIGISNSLNFIDRHIPLLKSMKCSPEVLNFKPYTVSGIKNILEHRLSHKSLQPLAHSSALELIARKSAGTGDLRKALALCRSALHLSTQSDSTFTQLSLESALTAVKTLSHQRGPELMATLTLQQRAVLNALIKEKKGSVTLIDLFVSYKSHSSEFGSGFPHVTRSEFSDIISFLESSGLVHLTSKSKQVFSSSTPSRDWLSVIVTPSFNPSDLPATGSSSAS